jgi:hypothetical protein
MIAKQNGKLNQRMAFADRACTWQNRTCDLQRDLWVLTPSGLRERS